MPKNRNAPEADRVDRFFSLNENRSDTWLDLQRATRRWASEGGGGQSASACQDCFNTLLPLEDFHAYPGPRLLETLRERLSSGDSHGAARLVRRISLALMTHAYRRDTTEWEPDEDAPLPSNVMPTAATQPGIRPYFEVLVVSPSAATTRPALIQQMRKLRRPLDAFVYEPVVVGSFEDAILASVLNASIQSVVIYEGFPYETAHEAPILQRVLESALAADGPTDKGGDLGMRLAKALRKIRPELDVVLLADRRPQESVSAASEAGVRRVFYQVEEPLELHLTLLGGIAERYETPFFDNLKKYAQKPVGTFHALPIARGKSVFRSDWIRDMGEFYGPTLFLAESSATTGGLDSLLEPTGNIKRSQDAAARAFGADRVFFVTNGTSTSNKMVYQALCAPGDIVIVDRNCHKSHHYGMVLAGAQPYYVEAFPLVAYSMYGAVPIRTVKKALLDLKASGRLDRVRMIALTNVTFDGHMYDVHRVMEECLAIKPDLVFLWDEAWFGFAHWSWLYRPRTAMGARARLQEEFRDPAYLERYLAQAKAYGDDLDPSDKRLLDARLIPDPRKAKLRVYQTNSTHKSMSSLRQGSMVLVADEEYVQHEQAFKEAVFTHASTSPNLQIIASLDLARRQMELEGYELVTRAIALAVELRSHVNTHPLVSKYFRILPPADMIPAAYRETGFKDYLEPGVTWGDVLDSMRKDEFVLDPTRITLVCGTAGYDGTQFKGFLATEYEIQLNKTSRNSVLLQTNINNTRSDIANLLKVLVEISTSIENRLASGDETARAAFAARVKSLMEDVPDLPNFSRFHDHFRDDPTGKTLEGDMRTAFYMAYEEKDCEHLKLTSPEIDKRLRSGPTLVSAHFVIPYPPGFPIMVPGQVIEADTIEFMRKLDVKEIHGYDAARGLKLIRADVLGDRAGKRRKAQPEKRSNGARSNGTKKAGKRAAGRTRTVSLQPARTVAPKGRVRSGKR
jgi:arginine decarboxylase